MTDIQQQVDKRRLVAPRFGKGEHVCEGIPQVPVRPDEDIVQGRLLAE